MIDDAEETLKLATNEIKKLKTDCERSVASGKCATFDEYKSITGRLKGYDDSLKVIGETLHKIQRG